VSEQRKKDARDRKVGGTIGDLELLENLTRSEDTVARTGQDDLSERVERGDLDCPFASTLLRPLRTNATNDLGQLLMRVTRVEDEGGHAASNSGRRADFGREANRGEGEGEVGEETMKAGESDAIT
jgi:hypothetical protein